MKKGQITLFVVLGIILVILVAIFIVFRETITEQAGKVGVTGTLTMTKEAREVRTGMTNCMEGLAETGLIIMGLQGGYTELDTRTEHTNTTVKFSYLPYSGTAYSYNKGQNLAPTKETMEKQIAKFLTDNSLACETEYTGLEVEYGRIEPSVEINNNDIKIELGVNIKVRKEGKESGFNNLDITIPARLGTIQSTIKKIVDEQIRTSKTEVCLSCISRTAAENNLEVDIDKLNDDVFYLITDKTYKIGGYDYIFITANRF